MAKETGVELGMGQAVFGGLFGVLRIWVRGVGARGAAAFAVGEKIYGYDSGESGGLADDHLGEGELNAVRPCRLI
jgi:hypothetical protein